MKYIDLHADTILPLLLQGEDSSLYENSRTHVDLKGLQEGKAFAQSFAIWLPNSDVDILGIDPAFAPTNQEEDVDYIKRAVRRLRHEVEEHSKIIAWANNATEMRENEVTGKISAILTLEDARAVNNSLENIDVLAEEGFQMVGILWNQENCFGFPNSFNARENQRGLKKFGIEAIRYMEELDILTDVSHLNEGGITDVLNHSNHPVVASHSNARELANHPRNLTDEHIKGIAESGGVIGLCFAPPFLRDAAEDSSIEDMVRHLNHLLDKGGEDVLAIGTDFDGTSGNFEIGFPSEMPKLFERLEQEKWPMERIEKFAYKNALRVFEK